MQPTWNRDDPKTLDGAVRSRLDGGDVRGAVGLLAERMGPAILAYLRTLLREDEAAEAYSDFHENVMKGLPGFRWECPIRAWAHRVAFHSAVRILRKPGRRLEEPLPSALSRLGAGAGPLEPIMSSRHAGLAQLRASLSVEDQTLLTLRIDRELEWEEIAAVLDLDAAALRKRFERLVKRLREEAREHGLID